VPWTRLRSSTTSGGRFPFIADQFTPQSSVSKTPTSEQTNNRPFHWESGTTQFRGTFGRPAEMSIHVLPRSVVRKMCGSFDPIRYPDSVANAELASKGSARTRVTHSVCPGMLTLVQLPP